MQTPKLSSVIKRIGQEIAQKRVDIRIQQERIHNMIRDKQRQIAILESQARAIAP